MSTVGDPSDSPQPPGAPPISAAAERARERLHEEIERVRIGVEQMLAEQEGGGDPALRRELDALREEMRKYVNRRVRKTDKRLKRSMREVDERISALEQRFEAFEQERRYAEWRIHTNTESMLDGLLREVRAIADLLTRMR